VRAIMAHVGYGREQDTAIAHIVVRTHGAPITHAP